MVKPVKVLRAEHADEQFKRLEMRAAELGMSLEEFIEQRLMDLQETQPDVYAELEQKIAVSCLGAVHLIRRASAQLAQLESKAQEENNTRFLEAVRDMQREVTAMFDCFTAAALLGDAETFIT